MLLGRKNNLTAPSLEILVASEVADEQCHELVILVGVHPIFEIHEALGKPYGLVVHIVWTVCLLAALGGVDEFKKCAQLLITAKGQLP